MSEKYVINIGDCFDKLKVIDEAGYRKDKHGYKKEKLFLCRCECGNETVVRKGNLIHGITKSCGCIKKNNTDTKWMNKSYRNDSLYSIYKPENTFTGCMYCGSEQCYSNGLCRNCYYKSIRGSLGGNLESLISVY